MAAEFVEVGEVVGVAHYAGKSFSPSTHDGRPINGFEICPSGPICDDVVDRALVAASVVSTDDRRAHFLSLRGEDNEGRPRYPGDKDLVLIRPDIVGLGRVTLEVPGFDELAVDLNDVDRDRPWGVRIHSGLYPAVDLGDSAAEVMTEYLRSSGKQGKDAPPVREVRLFGPHPDLRRRVRDEYLRGCGSNEIAGADGTALLLTNMQTLARSVPAGELADMRRARPNIVVDMPAGLEDRVDAVEIGEEGFAAVVAGACKRCRETGVDPDTAERDNLFLRQLAARTGRTALFGKGIYLGIGLNPMLKGTRPKIKVGDRVRVRLTDEPNVDLEQRRAA